MAHFMTSRSLSILLALISLPSATCANDASSALNPFLSLVISSRDSFSSLSCASSQAWAFEASTHSYSSSNFAISDWRAETCEEDTGICRATLDVTSRRCGGIGGDGALVSSLVSSPLSSSFFSSFSLSLSASFFLLSFSSLISFTFFSHSSTSFCQSSFCFFTFSSNSLLASTRGSLQLYFLASLANSFSRSSGVFFLESVFSTSFNFLGAYFS
mmetsp:Transcript_14035/g.28800  ORF Transcript_14035/g.28800 Transcript_14035/m.28800 type:complete len:215 (-) Transcript_14035:1588-2232(-)